MEKCLLINKGNIMVNFDRVEMATGIDLMYIWYENKIVATLDPRKYRIKYDFKGVAGTRFFKLTNKRGKK